MKGGDLPSSSAREPGLTAASSPALPSWRDGERVLALAFLVFCVCYGAGTVTFMKTSATDVVGPATFPRLLAVLGAICAIAHLVGSARQQRNQEGWEGTHSLLDLHPLGLTLIYALVFEPLGFALSTFLYLTVGVRTLGKSWSYSLLTAAISTVLFYLAFAVALESHLPAGPIPLP